MLAGIGQAYVWEGGSLFIGQSLTPTELHAHHAIQVSLVGDPPGFVRFRTAEEWVGYPGALVASRQPHAFDGGGAMTAQLFIELETREGQTIAELYLRDCGIVPLPRGKVDWALARLFGTWEETNDAAEIIPAAQRVIRELTGGAEPRTVIDDRVLGAIAYLRQNLHRVVSLEEVAAAVSLSPSRFRHLFVEETGMKLRPYQLWLRFMRAWEGIAAGKSLTAAAHYAGFADSPHLTRTCRRMFGIAPTGLQLARMGRLVQADGGVRGCAAS